MKKILITWPILTFVLALLFIAKPLWAAVRCEQIYGGGEVCIRTGELQIDKKVWDPETAQFVDNLGIHQYKFAPGEEIVFKLKIKNAGDEAFSKVDVRDYLPSYVEHLSGDLSFEIHDLVVDETEEREIKVKVVPADQFPADQSIICTVNTAEAWSEEERDKDTAQVCLEKKVLGVAVLPPTGPEDWLVILPFSLLAGLVGIYLTRIKD